MVNDPSRVSDGGKSVSEDKLMQELALNPTTTTDSKQLGERFVSLLGVYEKELYNFAYRLTGNRHDAEDLLQESFFKAYKYYFQLRDESKFKEWIFQITANQFKNILRKKKREKLSFPEDFERNITDNLEQAPKKNPDETFSRNDQSSMLREALAHVSPKMRTVLVLFELEGYAIEDISQMMSISRGTVKSRLHYARKKLKKILMSEEFVEKHQFHNGESEESE